MSCQHKFHTKTIYGKPVFVPCGSCVNCRKKNRTFWAHRITADVQSRYPLGSSFVTLTYSDDLKVLSKKDLQDFFKRIRHDVPFSYVAIGDYGSRTKRPHYHFLAIGLDPSNQKLVAKHWAHGFVKVDPVTSGRVNYVVNYMDNFNRLDKKMFDDNGLEAPFSLKSHGIGLSLFEEYPYGKYFYKGRWYTYPSYWRAKFNAQPITLSTQDLIQRNLEAHRQGFDSFASYDAYYSWLVERNSIHRDQQVLKAPQGIRHLTNSMPIVYK